MPFLNAVRATPDVSTCYQPGLRALGAYSQKINVLNPGLLEGSLDIDSCTIRKYPDVNRWDYAFAYSGEVFFIEVHSAHSSEVSTVLRKLQWLKDWLNQQAPMLNAIKARSRNPFYWVQSKNFSIPKTSRQYRAAKRENLIPVSILNLDY